MRTIRVLRLFYSPIITDEVHCGIIETIIGDIPYEAVTYTWGSTDKPCTIMVEGFELKVTKSAFTALQQLRLPDEDRLLWIDAICIDQNDPKEKSHQVGQMRTVYEKSEMVLVWLGLNNDCIDEFFEMMADPRLERLKSVGSKGVRFIPDETLRGAIERGFLELVARPWFRRVWIIQEIASARAATIACGPWRMSSAVFALIPAVFGFLVPARSQAVLDIMPSHSRRESWWMEQPDLHSLLSKFGKCEATDVRDKVFALMGIAVDGQITGCFLPDYEKTPDQVARDTASFILFHEVLDLSDLSCPVFTLDEFIESLGDIFERFFDWALHESRPDIILRLLGSRDRATQAYIQKKALLCYFADGEGERDDSLFEWVLSLDGRVNVNVSDQFGETPLHRAIRGGKMTRLKLLLNRKDILLNKPNRDGVSPLTQAIMLGRKGLEAVKILLAYDVDVNHMSGGLTPIAISIRQSSAAMVEVLLTRSDLDLNYGGFRPLLEAVQCAQRGAQQGGHELIIRRILDYRHLDIFKYQDGNAALMQAIQLRHRNLVALLRSNKVINDMYVRHSRITFQRAVLDHDVLSARRVLEVDRDLANELFVWKGLFCRVATSQRATRSNVSTALWYSVYNRDEEMIVLLIQQGCDIEIKDTQWSMSPLAVSCMDGQYAMTKLLLDHGACLISADWAKSEVVEWAAISGRTDIVKLLIQAGDARGQGLSLGQSLMKAVGLRLFEMVDFLLDNSAPTEHRDKFERTPLALAASIYDIEMMKVLMAFGADLGAEDCNRLTPSRWVAHHRRLSKHGKAVLQLPEVPLSRHVRRHLEGELQKLDPNIVVI